MVAQALRTFRRRHRRRHRQQPDHRARPARAGEIGDAPALVGFDDFELADLLDPPVSVVSLDPAELGRAAAELLFARLDGDREPPRRIVLPARLTARGSGETRP